MSNITHHGVRAMTSHGPFRESVLKVAEGTLVKALGEAEGKRKAVQFTLAFQATAQANPKLFDASPEQAGRALAMCMLTDLLPGGNHPQMWIIPKGGKINCWIAPHGYRELARRSGTFLLEIPVKRGQEADVEERVARCAEGGVFVPRPGEFVEALEHLAGFYLVVRDSIGARVEWMPASEVMKRRAVSDSLSSSYSPWKNWPMEMARKTALKWAFNRGLVSMDHATREAVSMETEQEIEALPEPVTEDERADMLGLPDDVDAEFEDMRGYEPGEDDRA